MLFLSDISKLKEMVRSDPSRHEMEPFGFHLDDFMDDTYFEQSMELIANENFDPAIQFSSTYGYGQISEDTSPEEVEDEGDESSHATQTRAAKPIKKSIKKADRTRTSISERRRGEMKEMLYELRSMVPNITKMDKASVIADAVLYIQQLQNKAKRLQTEIASIESSFSPSDEDEAESNLRPIEMEVTIKSPAVKKIFQMDVIQMENRWLYGRINSNKGQGIAALLYGTLESLEFLEVHSSHLATVGDNYILTFTLNVEELEVGLNLQSLKLWIASAFLNKGFHFVTLPSA